MAVAPLNLLPELEPWHLAGISHFLLEPEQARELRRIMSAPPARPGREAAPRPHPAPSYGLEQNQRFRPAAEAAQRGPAGAEEAPARGPASEYAALAEPAAGPLAARPERAGVGREAQAPENFPEAWAKLLARSQRAPLAWTYPELGLDLSGLGSPERGQALRTLIAALQLKRGTSTFWPLSLPEVGGDSRLFFHYGLDALEIRYLVIFGPQALEGTNYAGMGLSPFTEQVDNGRLVMLLPEFAELLSNPAAMGSATRFLRSVFSRYAAFR